MGTTKTLRNQSGSRNTNRGATGRTRAPWNKSGSCGTDRGPAEPTRPHRTNQGSTGLLRPRVPIQSRIRTPINRIRNRDGAGPRGTNWGPTRRIMAGGIDQGPREELGSAGRIRALRDASGPSGTRQGASGWMRWRAKRGKGAFGPWPLAIIKEKSTAANISFAPPPLIAKVGRLFGPQAEGP